MKIKEIKKTSGENVNRRNLDERLIALGFREEAKK